MLSIMKTFSNLVILCIMSAFVINRAEAQISAKMSYQMSDKIASLHFDRWDPANSRLKTSTLSLQGSFVLTWKAQTIKPGFIFDATSRNNNDLVYNLTLLNGVSARFTGKIASIEGRSTSTYYILEVRATGKSMIDPAGLYYYPLKRTNECVLTDYRLYRIAGFIIPRMLQFSYPGAYQTVKYPQFYSIK
jgi:hypothetical protein